ncbi:MULTISPECIES: hypothetical protein [Bacillaceae]|nr:MULTISPECIES: hypothetical protein [Bacillaceae]EFV74625.1 hypothetical protein HMPREF1013_05082 [Bacillus sp. 2_A_57_CT2]MCM3708805.1 hypothetical protein [Cytobacillus firmus]MBN8203869.1 hypothetical protein [Bacillus sp. NTK034]UQX57131.1 hypothetical protein M5V91_28710 [Cytobacillus pseudoceanisediminis]USK41966.1 hypothetical protein LIT27_14955 [Cytobacillus oceanisediminis]
MKKRGGFSILSNKKAREYAYINFPMATVLKENLDKYISQNYNISVFEFMGNLFDIKSLSRPVNLDCMNCHLAHFSLCCDGSPYPPTKEDINKVYNHVDNIFKETQSNSDYFKSKKYYSENGILDKNGSFIEHCGKCIFSIKIGEKGSHGCAIHGYAIKNNINYTKLKPKGCMMYPLDIVKLSDNSDFVFGADDNTVLDVVKLTENDEVILSTVNDNKGFSRWNKFDLNYICLNKNHRKLIMDTRKPQSEYSKASLPDGVFVLDEYVPAYEQEKRFIKELYGNETYEFIRSKSELLTEKGMLSF